MTLFLHIGRGKSGSSTIQGAVKNNHEVMRAQGGICPLTPTGEARHMALASALSVDGSDLLTIRRFRRVLAKHDNAKVFVSAENLFSLSTASIEHLKRLVKGRETRIICYVRDYPGWLQSLYAQSTKRGVNHLDFDDFYETSRSRISILPSLNRWAKVFGWDAMRIRPLEADALVGGDLVADVMNALGVEGEISNVEALNVSPHWMVVELQRAVVLAGRERSLPISPQNARHMGRLFERCTGDTASPRIQYVTRAQWDDLSALYERDMLTLNANSDVPRPAAPRPPDERAFLPESSRVPEAVKREIEQTLSAGRFSAAQIPPHVVSLIRSVIALRQ
ncbi:MAG: hypothetical protein J0H08_10540 [Rhizobiales bacterium]|nr:hypothetical protein [Hyphomicrobiales bacterium]